MADKESSIKLSSALPARQLQSHIPAIVGPMKQSLSLFWSAMNIAFVTMLANLGDMSLHGFVSLNLALVIGATSAHVIATVPLEPAPRIFMINPALLSPIRQGL